MGELLVWTIVTTMAVVQNVNPTVVLGNSDQPDVIVVRASEKGSSYLSPHHILRSSVPTPQVVISW
jgi:hypothetical protein